MAQVLGGRLRGDGGEPSVSGSGSQAGAAHKGPDVGERAADGGGDPAGPRLQFGATETIYLRLTPELRARIRMGHGHNDLGFLEFINEDGSLNLNPQGVKLYGIDGGLINIFEGQHIISWAIEYQLKVEGGQSYNFVPSKVSFVREC